MSCKVLELALLFCNFGIKIHRLQWAQRTQCATLKPEVLFKEIKKSMICLTSAAPTEKKPYQWAHFVLDSIFLVTPFNASHSRRVPMQLLLGSSQLPTRSAKLQCKSVLYRFLSCQPVQLDKQELSGAQQPNKFITRIIAFLFWQWDSPEILLSWPWGATEDTKVQHREKRKCIARTHCACVVHVRMLAEPCSASVAHVVENSIRMPYN